MQQHKDNINFELIVFIKKTRQPHEDKWGNGSIQEQSLKLCHL